MVVKGKKKHRYEGVDYGYKEGETWWQRWRRVGREQGAIDDARRKRNAANKKAHQEAVTKSYKAKFTGTNAKKQIASAVVRQNNKETDWKAEYEKALEGLTKNEKQAVKEIEKASRREAELEKNLALTQAQKRYIDDVQAFLYTNLDQIAKNFERYDSQTQKRKQIYKLADTVPDGSYINLLSNRGPITADGAMYSQFVHATPAQLAYLQPMLRFFMVAQDGSEEEIYFSDYTTGEYAKKIANLRSSGDINDILSPRNQRGSDAGIRSFTWNYHNKHEGDFIIEANLELYFGTLAELANINYLQFLFPTGNATELASSLESHSNSVSRGESRQRRITLSEKIGSIEEKITAYEDILKSPLPDIVKIPKILNDKTMKASRKKEFRQLKVIVGWSVPKGDQGQLRKSFPDPASYQSFISGLEATNKAIFLNLSDYNVEFQQDGPTTLSLSYLGSTDNYLATSASDVFGSNNEDPTDNDYMYKETDVSTGGFLSDGNKIVDLRRTESEEASKLSENGASLNPDIGLEPYIQSIVRRQGKNGAKAKKNALGEPLLGVTLAGLRAAQDLQSLRLQKAQLQQKDENSSEVNLIRLRGQFLTLLYERATAIRLRDIYSKYLDNLITTDYVHRARIQTSGSPATPPKLIVDPVKISEEEKKDVVREKSLLPSGYSGANIEPTENTVVYYMRLGDLLHRAIQTSGLRDDISLILGNTTKVDSSNSIYDIPITIDVFGQFFYNRVVSRQLRSYPFRYFLNDILKVVARLVNNDPKIYDRIAFDYTVISGRGDIVPDLDFKLNTADLLSIGQSQEHPLNAAGIKFHHFYPVFETNTSHRGRTGNKAADERDGIYHYVIGSDKGLAKNFNFSRQETEYFQEMLIESNNLDDKIQALFLPQNVNLTMFGNTLHKNGDLIYIDSRPSLGSFAGPVLGIGGYYRVIRSTHEISNRGYETNLECVFELRVSPDKTGRSR